MIYKYDEFAEAREISHDINQIPNLLEKKLFFSQDKAAVQKCSNLVLQKSRKISSHCLGPTFSTEAPKLETSHLNSMSSMTHHQVFTTFSNSRIEWNRLLEPSAKQNYHETPVQDVEDDISEVQSSECRPELNPTWKNRVDCNIMTFRDQGTMTRNSVDASCGAQLPPVAACTTSEASVMASDTTAGWFPISRRSFLVESRSIPDRSVMQIDQRCQSARCHYSDIKYVRYPFYHKDINKTERPDIIIPEKISRKNIYNEGIKDVILDCIPSHPIGIKYPIFSSSKCCNKRECVKNIVDDSKNFIPYSFKSASRYHEACKERSSNYNFEHECEISSNRKMTEFPNKCKQKILQRKHPRSGLPKRILSSNPDFDFFLKDNNFSSCTTKE
ncbi:uncharacterized protein LOC133534515 [Cydia pomonella]|uniref:uncharacterized protein LOC133534515 n=1 Tax=Cydia pomonella TaxID=82600 RepID=UPI002ADDD191|nr:uncharacterized protein LOC133534515 [Cydia pomonella]